MAPEKSCQIEHNFIARCGDQPYPSFELRLIMDHLREEGHESWCQQQLKEMGVSVADLLSPFIPSHLALDGLRRVCNSFGQSGLGCDIAKSFRIAHLGLVGTCVRSASTLYEALQISQDYYDFIGSFTDIVNLSDTASFTNRLVDVSRLDPAIMRLLFELTVMGMRVLAEEISGEPIKLETVRFTGSLSAEELELYQNLFNCEVIDESRFNEWSVSIDCLQRPVAVGSESSIQASQDLRKLLDMLEQHQEGLLKQSTLVGDISSILQCSKGSYPGPDCLSTTLGMSSRTLRRRLNGMGTSYSALIDKVRCQLAINLIQDQGLSNEAVAESLGYSDAANFSHAFKKWTGQTPNYYRLDV